VENSFDIQENNEFANENYKLNKTRISFGLILDFRTSNRYKNIQQEKITMAINTLDELSNEEGEAQKNHDSNFDQLLANVNELEQKLNSKTTQLNNDYYNLKNRLIQLDSITNAYRENNFLKVNITGTDTYTKALVKLDDNFFYFPQISHVFFPYNSSYFDTNKYHNSLSNLATYLKQNPNSILNLIGYADMLGSAKHNANLSQKRANRIRQYLIEKFDTSPESIESFGLGQTNLFSKTDPKKNRKTQILIKRRK
jgi:outer membrane protein OmpA-like peptidoglycan-associated protein